jgi:hypothetical protein
MQEFGAEQLANLQECWETGVAMTFHKLSFVVL